MPFTVCAPFAAQAKKRVVLEKEYTLRSIIAKRRRKGVTEYLCAWQDYGVDGIRFDLMGHLPLRVMLSIRAAVARERVLPCHLGACRRRAPRAA